MGYPELCYARRSSYSKTFVATGSGIFHLGCIVDRFYEIVARNRDLVVGGKHPCYLLGVKLLGTAASFCEKFERGAAEVVGKGWVILDARRGVDKYKDNGDIVDKPGPRAHGKPRTNHVRRHAD